MKKLLVPLVIVVMLILFIFLYYQLKNHSILTQTDAYLSKEFPDETFTHKNINYMLDGGIYKVVYHDTQNQSFNVYYANGKIYDDFLRQQLEKKMKNIICDAIELPNNIHGIDISLDQTYEDDPNLKREIKEGKAFKYIVIFHHNSNYNRIELSQTYSKMGHILFEDYNNITSFIVKNYDNVDEELFILVDKDSLMGDYSIQNLEKYMSKQKMTL